MKKLILLLILCYVQLLHSQEAKITLSVVDEKCITVQNDTIQTVITSIYGSVVDQDGKPVVGASVRISGTRLGGFVHSDGKYHIKGGSNNYIIVIPAFASRRSPCRNPLFMRLRRFLHTQQ